MFCCTVGLRGIISREQSLCAVSHAHSSTRRCQALVRDVTYRSITALGGSAHTRAATIPSLNTSGRSAGASQHRTAYCRSVHHLITTACDQFKTLPAGTAGTITRVKRAAHACTSNNFIDPHHRINRCHIHLHSPGRRTAPAPTMQVMFH